MKTKTKLLVRFTAPVILAALFCAIPARAQTPSMDWYTVDGGGGSSATNGVTLSGTIGQPDAGLLLARPPGGAYAMSGGFWGMFDPTLPSFGAFRICLRDGVVYLPGSPYYQTVLLQWPDAGLKLQAAGELAVNPTNTAWADVNPASYSYVSSDPNPDLCGDVFSTFAWTVIDKATARSLHPNDFLPSVTPLVPALFSSQLDGPQAGAFDSAGKGAGNFRLFLTNGTTYQLALDIGYGGLTTNATLAHIHGPAAGILYSLAPYGALGTNHGTFIGTLALTTGAGGFTVAQQLDQLRGGQWYVDVHTASHPAGEIRGQIYLKQQFFRAVPQ